MGGDGGIEVTVPAAVQALENNPDLTLYLVGDENRIGPLLSSGSEKLRSRIELVHTEFRVGDEEKPASVLRSGKQSSMYMAVELVKSGAVQAMVSAGNTGALLLIGRHLLKTIKGIRKPAIVATIPGASRQSYLLDVGANLECDGAQLFEFAVMGAVLAESLNRLPPRVGLLNIGSEQYKGTEEVRLAGELLERCAAIDYVGFIEANALFEGMADVVVCDGFVGNVTIKASAGVANVVNQLLANQIAENWLSRLKGFFSASMLTRLRAQINPNRFNGASLLGLQGIIVKSHGNATSEGFTYAIYQAIKEVENQVPQLIAERVAAIIEAN